MERNIKIILLACISLLCIRCENQVIEPEHSQDVLFNTTQSQIVEADNRFGIRLLQEISGEKQEENILISPLSVSMALSMALNGARGDTYDAIRDVLGYHSLFRDEINESCQKIRTMLTTLDPLFVFDMANAIWIQKDLAVKEPFILANQHYFNAVVENLDFDDPASVDYINNWVADATHHNIPVILNSIPPETALYLMNTIYFNGRWSHPFEPARTKSGPFYLPDGNEITIEMMNRSERFPYFETVYLQAIDLPYRNGHFSMTILLPRPGVDIDTFIADLTYNLWSDWLNLLEERAGELTLPKFSITFKMDFLNVLHAMGMGVAFSRQADFSGISENIPPIDQVLHKTGMLVGERGTEAAAVTSVRFCGVAPEEEFTMIVNRPFLCVIRERSSNTILFAGKVMQPEWVSSIQ